MERQHLPIYIVDDDESVRRSLKRLLRSFGRPAEAFSSAQSFLSAVDRPRGILILDISMPGMDGFALFRELSGLPALHVIFITARSRPGDRERAMAHGAAGFLLKPFDEAELMELIQRAEEPAAG